MFNFTNVSLINEVSVITNDDNLLHKYFTNLEWSEDNSTPTGYVYLQMPYNEEILKYWSTYAGAVTVNAKLVSNDKNTTEKQQTSVTLPNTSLETTAIERVERLQNDEYNYSFIGRITDAKQIGKTIKISLENVGWKFLQKVPKHFRESYVAGQSLGDAFQAMCELMNIDFAYSIEDLSQYKFAADGYSIEKDGEIIEEVPSLFKEWGDTENKNEDEEEADALNEIGNEFEGEIDRKQKNTQSNASNIASNMALALNSQVTNNNNDNNSTNTEEDETKDTIEDKIEKYQEEFDEKVKDLFIGNTLYDSNVTDSILNYNSITVQPTATTTTDISAVNNTSTTSSATSSENQSNNSNSGSSSSTSSSTKKSNGVKGVYGKTAKGSYYLTQDAINKMSMAEAKRRYEDGQKRHIYTAATMQKLWYRWMFGTKFY